MSHMVFYRASVIRSELPSIGGSADIREEVKTPAGLMAPWFDLSISVYWKALKQNEDIAIQFLYKTTNLNQEL